MPNPLPISRTCNVKPAMVRGISTPIPRDLATVLCPGSSACRAIPPRTALISMKQPIGSRFDIGMRKLRRTPLPPRPGSSVSLALLVSVREKRLQLVHPADSPLRQFPHESNQDPSRRTRIPQRPVSLLDADPVVLRDGIQAPIGKVGEEAPAETDGAQAGIGEHQLAARGQ